MCIIIYYFIQLFLVICCNWPWLTAVFIVYPYSPSEVKSWVFMGPACPWIPGLTLKDAGSYVCPFSRQSHCSSDFLFHRALYSFLYVEFLGIKILNNFILPVSVSSLSSLLLFPIPSSPSPSLLSFSQESKTFRNEKGKKYISISFSLPFSLSLSLFSLFLKVLLSNLTTLP